jgi:hypothetical protein
MVQDKYNRQDAKSAKAEKKSIPFFFLALLAAWRFHHG